MVGGHFFHDEIPRIDVDVGTFVDDMGATDAVKDRFDKGEGEVGVDVMYVVGLTGVVAVGAVTSFIGTEKHQATTRFYDPKPLANNGFSVVKIF
jgi:hypothetical protein